MRRWFAAALALAASMAFAADESVRTLVVDGEPIVYTLHRHPPGAHLTEASAPLAPDTPLNAFRLLNRHLVAGDIEEAALLSNEPKRRFVVLREYRDAVGEEPFRKVFQRYFLPENRLVAEARIGGHSLLVWRLADEKHLAGQYYMQVENRWLMDDVPSAVRLQLRRVLDSFRATDGGDPPQ